MLFLKLHKTLFKRVSNKRTKTVRRLGVTPFSWEVNKFMEFTNDVIAIVISLTFGATPVVFRREKTWRLEHVRLKCKYQKDLVSGKHYSVKDWNMSIRDKWVLGLISLIWSLNLLFIFYRGHQWIWMSTFPCDIIFHPY